MIFHPESPILFLWLEIDRLLPSSNCTRIFSYFSCLVDDCGIIDRFDYCFSIEYVRTSHLKWFRNLYMYEFLEWNLLFFMQLDFFVKEKKYGSIHENYLCNNRQRVSLCAFVKYNMLLLFIYKLLVIIFELKIKISINSLWIINYIFLIKCSFKNILSSRETFQIWARSFARRWMAN